VDLCGQEGSTAKKIPTEGWITDRQTGTGTACDRLM
jgi:hypothetical protein